MKQNFSASLTNVLTSEGGFVMNPKDPGGMTNLGCTKATWESWVKHPVTELDMRNLKPNDVAPLYRLKYWDKVSGDLLPSGVDYAVFDAAINSGTGRAVKLLQEILKTDVDGIVGSQTLKKLAARNPLELIAEYQEHRLAFLKTLPAFSDFGHGWTNRVLHVGALAAAMV